MSDLLKEGGLGGHMPHLYENPYLTFKNLKDVLTKASEGHLEGTEKTDGQNLFISYSTKDGKAKAARNKGNIKGGGLTAKGLAEKFGGRGSLELAFTEAFNSFEKSVGALTDEEKLEIFGKDADIFYNAEIQDPRNANVINYDFKTLNIHRVGHARYNKETDQVENVDTAENAAKLENALEKMKDNLEHDGFRIQMNAIRRLEALSSDEQLLKALGRLEEIISSVGISDDQTIGDYLTATIVPMIKQDFPSIPEERMVMLMDRLFRGTEVPAKEIKAGLDKDQQKDVSTAVKKLSDYFKASIAPIEDAIHDFAVEILKSFHSTFVLDNDKEVKRLQGEVAAAIKGIEASGREDAMEILTKQLSKLKKAENVSSASEGFVFDYDGKTYKFTGNFAPANQLLGLFKYGRGKIPALSKMNEAIGEGKKLLVLLPGGYKPPTAGHYEMIKFYNDQEDVEKILVLIGPEERGGIDRGKAMEVFDLYGVNEFGKVSIEETEHTSPLRAAYEFIISDPRAESYKHLFISVGASDKEDEETGKIDFERSEIFVDYFNRYPDKVPEGFEIGTPPCCPAAGGKEKISATNLRKAILDNDLKAIKKLIPKDVNAEELLSIVKGLQEISAMGGAAGGAIEGHMGAKSKREKKKSEFKFEYIDRRKFIMSLLEEKKIRQLVRKAIIVEEQQRKEKEKNDSRLRTLVKKVLLEAKLDEPQYEVTFMNVLKQLLDNTNTMTIIKNHFMMVRTPPKAEQQRGDFRDWLVEYIKNFLSIPEEMVDAAKIEYEKIKGGGEPETLPLQEKIEIEDIDDMPEVVGPGKIEEPEELPEEDPEAEEEPEEEVESLDLPVDGDVELEGDDVGKTFALEAFGLIKTNLEKAFNKVIKDQSERENFGKYLLINLLMNMDNFEDELAGKAPEAGVSGYEPDAAGELGGAELGGEEELGGELGGEELGGEEEFDLEL